MKFFSKLLISCLLLLLVNVEEVFGQKSRPSFSGGSSSRPSFSGGSSSKPSFSGGSSSSSKPSFSGGSSSSKPSSSSRPTFTTNSATKTTSTTPIPGREPTSVSKKPLAPSFDTVAQSESRKASSRSAYERSEAPAKTYKTSAGKEVKLDPNDKESKNIRSKTTNEQWVHRETRESNFYAPYASRPIVYYNDPYHPLMTYWLLSQSIENQALWMHHHQDSLKDSARVDAIYRENAQLKARVDALSNTPRDPSWTPDGVEPDLLYHENYVNSSFNPKPKEETSYEYEHINIGKIFLQILVTMAIIIVLVVICYSIYHILFVKKFNFEA